MTAEQVVTGVYRVRVAIVNAYFVVGENGWVLIDAGIPGGASRIRKAALELFGDRPPQAILLTHGHFDHVGALPELADEWGVPIYVHSFERPYVTGELAYPPPDPTAGGGMMSLMSVAYPRGPYDFSPRVLTLPENGDVPSLPEWKWLLTPGHTDGHVSFFRESDRTLIAGDAVVTTKNESLTAVLTELECVWRPPAYFTPDWDRAASSVQTIADLDPDVLAAGHGRPMRGDAMRRELRALAKHFEDVIPTTGVPLSWRVAGIVAAVMATGVVLRQVAKIGQRREPVIGFLR
jgi:glyoxylase-like metal-dependent hydrolase (beta-lactamase superfamily II)